MHTKGESVFLSKGRSTWPNAAPRIFIVNAIGCKPIKWGRRFPRPSAHGKKRNAFEDIAGRNDGLIRPIIFGGSPAGKRGAMPRTAQLWEKGDKELLMAREIISYAPFPRHYMSFQGSRG